jgi:4-hydroxy-tetrahydrodipicolinate reductase
MSIRVLVNGAYGRMGSLSCETIETHNELILAGRCGSKDDLTALIDDTQPDVVLDFSTAHSVWENAQTITAKGIRPIIGASGLNPKQIEQLSSSSKEKQLGGLIVPNFSIASLLMMRCSAEIAKHLNHVEIIEMHHDKKIDSPSGTAIATAQKISNASKMRTLPTSKEVVPHARGAQVDGIAVHAIRLPGIIAKQQVIFADQAETLSICHDTLSRDAFMPGVILACQKVMGLKQLHIGLDICLD